MKLKINTDRILGISAMIISLLTLIIFIYQTNIMREQSKLSVKPRIAFSTDQSSRDSLVQIKGRILNKGLGPAIIDSIYIEYQGQPYRVDMEAFIEAEMPDLKKLGNLVMSTTLSKGNTLLAGEEITIYSFRFIANDMPEIMQTLGMENPDKAPFEFKTVYSSIYEDEKWMVSSESDEPITLE